MSTAPPSSDPPPNNEKPEVTGSSEPTSAEGTAAMDVTPDAPPEETWDDIPEDILALNTDEIITRTRLIDNDIKVGPLPPVIIGDIKTCIGDEVGNPTVATRAKCDEGEDSGQRREDQAEQSSSLSGRKCCRGMLWNTLLCWSFIS